MLRLLTVPAIFVVLRAVYHSDYSDLLVYYSKQSPAPGTELGMGTLFETLGFIIGTLVMALFIDSELVMKMFISKNGELDVMNIINWVCSLVFLANLPYVIGYSRHFDVSWTEVSNPSSPAGITLILAFSTISFLTGYFFRSTAVKQYQDSGKYQMNWKQLVPPAYYAGCTAYVVNAHCLMAVTLGSFFFASNLLSALIRSPLDSSTDASATAETATSTTKKESYPTHLSNSEKKATSASVADVDGSSCAADASLYTSVDTPAGNGSFHWYRQLCFDFLAYLMPLIILGSIFPVLQIPLGTICVLGTVFPHVYDFTVKKLFLYPSELENPAKAQERLDTYLPGAEYPTGWFRLADSAQLARKEVKYIRAVGRDLAMFRGEDGKVRCVDAYCVHLGANMAMGGRVVNNCLECPFHRWQFAGDGKCTSIPYSPSIPKQAKTRAYHVYEFFGMVLVWLPQFDGPQVHQGEKDSKDGKEKDAAEATTAPPYYPPEPLKLSEGGKVYRGTQTRIVNMHIQEFAENSTDFAHFQPLHGTMTLPYTTVEIPAITINHRPDWNEGVGDQTHICWFHDTADINLYGKPVPNSGAVAKITFVGPASVVYFTFETPIGSIVLFQTHTPLAPLRLETKFRWYADAHMPRGLVWYIVGNWIAQWQNDIMVWENKKFWRNPLLVRGDGPMNKTRRWFKQFYVPPAGVPKPIAYAPTAAPTADAEATAAQQQQPCGVSW